MVLLWLWLCLNLLRLVMLLWKSMVLLWLCSRLLRRVLLLW